MKADILQQIADLLPEAPEYVPPHKLERITLRSGTFSITMDFNRSSLVSVAEKIKRGYRRPRAGPPKRSLRGCQGGPFHGARVVVTDGEASTAYFRVNGGPVGRYAAQHKLMGALYWEELPT